MYSSLKSTGVGLAPHASYWADSSCDGITRIFIPVKSASVRIGFWLVVTCLKPELQMSTPLRRLASSAWSNSLAEGAVQDLPHHLLLLGPQKREIQEHDLRHEEREDGGRLLGHLDGAEHRLLDLVAQAPQLLRGKDLDVVVALGARLDELLEQHGRLVGNRDGRLVVGELEDDLPAAGGRRRRPPHGGDRRAGPAPPGRAAPMPAAPVAERRDAYVVRSFLDPAVACAAHAGAPGRAPGGP